MFYKKIGIVIADEGEYTPFLNMLNGVSQCETPFRSAIEFSLCNSDVTAVLCGIGKVNASAAAMYLIDRGCNLLLNFGLSGGLKGVRRGEFVLPESFLEHDFDLTALGYKPCEKPGQTYIYKADNDIIAAFAATGAARPAGTAVCGDRFVSDAQARDFLISNFSASCCDMETAAIAAVCYMSEIPFAAVRRISDSADDTAADSYSDMNENEGVSLAQTFIRCLNSVCAKE